MKRFLVTAKKSLAVLLSAAVIFTALPQAGLSAYAASTDDSIVADSEISPSEEEVFDGTEVENDGESSSVVETVPEETESEEIDEDAAVDVSAGDAVADTFDSDISVFATEFYPVSFVIEGKATVFYRDSEGDSEETEWKEYIGGTINASYDSLPYILPFIVVPEEGYVIDFVSPNIDGITARRMKNYDQVLPGGRGYDLYAKKPITVEDSIKVFVSVEEARDYTLTFDYSEDLADVSAWAKYNDTSETLELTDKSVKVNELKKINFTVEIKDVAKTLLVQYEDEEGSATLTADNTEEVDSNDDGKTDRVRYEYNLGSLVSDTTVSISVVDRCEITFNASYGINEVDIVEPLDEELYFYYEDDNSTSSKSISVPAGSQLTFNVWQDRYERGQKSVNIEGDNGGELTSKYDYDLDGYFYTFIPTGDTTITLSVKPVEFIFEYEESEVELLVYEDGSLLKLSENNGVDIGFDRTLDIKVKPVEGKRAKLQFRTWDEGPLLHEFEEIDKDGYYCYQLETYGIRDNKLTIVCYDTCSITFKTEGDASDNISILYRCYDGYETWWEEYKGIDGGSVQADIGKKFYFMINDYNEQAYKQICTSKTGDVISQLEVYNYDDDTEFPIYCLVPEGDTTVTINRSTLQEYMVTVVKGNHVIDWKVYDDYGDDYVSDNGNPFTVKEGRVINVGNIKVDGDYKALVAYASEGGEQQAAKIRYGADGEKTYLIEITGDTTIYISAEPIGSYDVTFENIGELDSIEIWEDGNDNISDNQVLTSDKITLSNDKHYYFRIAHKDGTYIDSVVCSYDDSDTETVLEKKPYFFNYDGDEYYRAFVDCYDFGGGFDVKGDLTIKVNLLDGYTLAFDTTVRVLPLDDDVINDYFNDIASKKIGLPLTTGYSFYLDYFDADECDVSIDSTAFVLTKMYRSKNEDYVYSVTPKKGAELPKKVTVSIKKRGSESHIVTLDYPDTIRAIGVQSYPDDITCNSYRIKEGAVTVDNSPLTLTLKPVNGYTAEVTIKGQSDTESVTLTPYRNYEGKKEYYIGTVTEDKTIKVTTSKGIWQPDYYTVGFFSQRAHIIDSVYKTSYDTYDDSLFEDYIDEYSYYVTKGESISFYVNPYYGYAVEGVFAGDVEIIPKWDETLWKYVYTVTPDQKNTLITINTVNNADPTAPVGPDGPANPDDPVKPDDPTAKYDVIFNYTKAVKSILFKDDAYTLAGNKITVPSGTEVAFKPEPADGYKISSVTANGNVVSADTNGYYVITVKAATEIDITAVEESTSTPGDTKTNYDVTFSYPETVKTITFKNGAYTLAENKITVLAGTEVAFKPEPADGYKISSVTANGVNLAADGDGYYVITVSAATEIVVSAAKEGTGTPGGPDIQRKGIQIVGLKASYVYTGAKIMPEIEVWDCDIENGKLLSPSVDYTLKYKNNTKVGTNSATITVTGKGNYAGTSVSAQFSIVEAQNPLVAKENLKDLKGAKIAKIDAVPYTGEYLHPDFTLTLKNESAVTYRYDEVTENYYVLQNGTLTSEPLPVNWALSNNRNKGTATLLLTGKDGTNNKPTTVKTTFKINAVDLSKASNVVVTVVDEPKNIKYSVKGTTPKVEVKVGGTILIDGTDYTVKYASNKKVTDSAKITITGKGNYAKKPANLPTFKINPLSMEGLEVSAVTAYDGIRVNKVKATVLDENKGILKASQYTVAVYKVSEDGHTTKLEASETLNTGDKICVTATAKDKKNLVENSSTLLENAETFTVGKNIAAAKFKVNKDSTTNKAAKMYTGDEIKLTDADLTVTIKEKGTTTELHMAGSGKTNECYEIVEYSNNTNKGTATAVIRGINGYSGTKTVKFKIVAKAKK